MTPIFRILVPIDFSERCLGMMPYVAAIARRYNSEVTLLHVTNPLYALPAAGMKLDNASIYIREGDIAKEVCCFAHSIGADLLVIRRGSHDVAGGRLRSNVYAVIRQASCPVLSV